MPTQKQINANRGFYRTTVNTTWLYPDINIKAALATTTYKYTFDGTFITCPDMANLQGVYNDIFINTAISQPLGNDGYSLGVGTFCQDFGKTIYWQLSNGITIIKWQLVKQITPQSMAYIPSPGNSVDNTVGYITTYNIVGWNNILDAPFVNLTG
jgi:hypothetical protein